MRASLRVIARPAPVPLALAQAGGPTGGWQADGFNHPQQVGTSGHRLGPSKALPYRRMK
jgi:hypothetical protein